MYTARFRLILSFVVGKHHLASNMGVFIITLLTTYTLGAVGFKIDYVPLNPSYLPYFDPAFNPQEPLVQSASANYLIPVIKPADTIAESADNAKSSYLPLPRNPNEPPGNDDYLVPPLPQDMEDIGYAANQQKMIILANGEAVAEDFGKRINQINEGNGMNQIVEKESVQQGKGNDGRMVTIPINNDGRISIGQGNDGRIAIGPSNEGRIAIVPSNDGRISIGPSNDGRITIGQSNDGRIAIGQGNDGRISIGQSNDGRISIGQSTDGRIGQNIDGMSKMIGMNPIEAGKPGFTIIEEYGYNQNVAQAKSSDSEEAYYREIEKQAEIETEKKFRESRRNQEAHENVADYQMHAGKLQIPVAQSYYQQSMEHGPVKTGRKLPDASVATNDWEPISTPYEHKGEVEGHGGEVHYHQHKHIHKHSHHQDHKHHHDQEHKHIHDADHNHGHAHKETHGHTHDDSHKHSHDHHQTHAHDHHEQHKHAEDHKHQHLEGHKHAHKEAHKHAHDHKSDHGHDHHHADEHKHDHHHGHKHSHHGSHGHEHKHDHHHGHDHGHKHSHDQDHKHVHSHENKHGHKHEHKHANKHSKH